MKERPILFSAPMVKAILAGTKTVTRRVLRQPNRSDGAQLVPDLLRVDAGHACPYGAAGDRLWVRETWGWRGSHWRGDRPGEVDVHVAYQADGAEAWIPRPCPADGRIEGTPRFRCGKDCDRDPGGRHGDEMTKFWASWRPSIFLPRWASRITLDVVSVRVERLQDITEEDARAEGVVEVAERGSPEKWARWSKAVATRPIGEATDRGAFAMLWEGINGERAGWASNPWVWRVEFRREGAPPGQ